MAVFTLNVNKKKHEVDVSPDMPVLWVLRDVLDLTGTKFGCGVAQCGSCTIHVDGTPVKSCVLPVSAAEGKKIVTIEGLSKEGDHPVQQAWKEADVPQCGYCQAGQTMTAAAFLQQNPTPSEEDIENAMAGNLCRCGTYLRIKKAIHLAVEKGGLV